jgi:hypothetical protein
LMRLQDIIMREAPSSYIFDSDGTARRQRTFDGEPAVALVGEAHSAKTSAPA